MAKRRTRKVREPDVTITIKLYTDRDATAKFEGPIDGKWVARGKRALSRGYRKWKLSRLRDRRMAKLEEREQHQKELDRVGDDAIPVLASREETEDA